MDEFELVERAMRAGVKVYPAGASYFGTPPDQPGIIFGFGSISTNAIQRGIDSLAQAWL